MSQTQAIFVCLRNRDFDGLGEWIERLLELTKDEATQTLTGRMRYDGHVLVPLLQSADKEVSKALLANPSVRSAMQSKNIEHDNWILDIAQNDTFAWLWAVEQGWGTLVEPRPSVLKHMTILRVHGFIEQYFADAQKVLEDKMDVQAGKQAWDGWLRLASNRNPWLITHLYAPLRTELEQVVQCSQPMSFPPHFWDRMEVSYPGIGDIRKVAQATYSGLGLPYGAAEDKVVLGKGIGLIAKLAESISVEFESGQ